jgi:HK97 family phage portal protein
MGLLQTLGLRPNTKKVDAQYSPAIMDSNYGYGSFNTAYNSGFGAGLMDRQAAMQVPAVARCRNLIAGTVASLDLELYRKSTGKKLQSPLWLDQPDLRQPRSVTMAWTIDSLIFYGESFWRVTSLYADDLRPSGFEWIANNRVTVTTNQYGDQVEYYSVNGVRVPNSGIGSLITFQGLTNGILLTGSRTIQSALDVEKAAAVASQTPMATTVIKNSGADLPEAQISGLLASWKASRQSRSTAYLTSTLSVENLGFSPKEMLYNDASQFLACQVARLMNVPAFMISAEMNNGSSMTYQNILDARKEFVAYSLQPYISAVENRLSMNDVTAAGNLVKFAVDDTFLRGDAMDRLDVIEKMLNLGLINIDQAKEMEDLTPEGNENPEIDEVMD